MSVGSHSIGFVRLLWNHKEVEVKWYGSKSYQNEKYGKIYKNMFQLVDDVCMDENIEELADKVDVNKQY